MTQATTSNQQTTQKDGGNGRDAAERGAGGRNKGSKEGFRQGQGKRPMKKNRKPRAEFAQKIIGIRRVTRVMRGGRRFGFSVSVVIGDKKGRVGLGMAKAGDTALAIEKAYNQAKRNLVTLNLTSDNSIPHEVQARSTASEVLMKPARGKGIIAGSTVRNVLELGGVNDVSAKLLTRSKNTFNNAKAAIEALSQLKQPKGSASTAQESARSEPQEQQEDLEIK